MSGTVYLGTVGQSVWRSRDGGETWALLHLSLATRNTGNSGSVTALLPVGDTLFVGAHGGLWQRLLPEPVAPALPRAGGAAQRRLPAVGAYLLASGALASVAIHLGRRDAPLSRRH